MLPTISETLTVIIIHEPDIRVREIGLNAQFIFNNRRFSYRAGFLQNDWQKKSAGTFLLGWQLLFGNGASDSTIFPSKLTSLPPEEGEARLSFIETGPTAGYAFTLVIKKHFFIMASATITFDIGYNRVKSPYEVSSTSFIPNFGLKSFAGYNSKKTAIVISFTNEATNFSTGRQDNLFSLNTGNIRLNFVQRFQFDKTLLRKRD